MIFITHGASKVFSKSLDKNSVLYYIKHQIMKRPSQIKHLIQDSIEIDYSLERKYELIVALFITPTSDLIDFAKECL